MLIGVICEVISQVAAHEREDLLLDDLKVKLAKITKLLTPHLLGDANETLDFDRPNMISRDMYHNILENDEACQTLDEVGVDVVALAELADFIFPECGEIEMTDFLHLILQFRGSNTATVKDIVDMRKFMVEQLRTG